MNNYSRGDPLGYRISSASINTARAIYALNWFDIAPGLTYIAKTLSLRILDLGIMTTSFYVGLAMFQMVGGVLASRYGPKMVAFIGITILGAAGILSGLSTNLLELVLFRYVAGAGSALFFSPGLSLLRHISPPESFGFQVGIYNGAFNLGGGIGAFGWVFVDSVVGWRLSLIIGGLLAIGIALENLVVLRGLKEPKVGTSGFGRRLSSIIKNKYLWIVATGTIVVIFSETIIGQFIIYFSENNLRMTASEAGFIDGLFLIIGFVGGVIGGHIFSTTKHRMAYTYFVLGITGFMFIMIAFARNFVVLTIIIGILGLVTVSGFSILYTIAAEIVEDKAMVSFSLSFVNFIQLVIGSISPFVFADIAYYMNYTYAWAILGIFGLLMIPLLISSRKYFEPLPL